MHRSLRGAVLALVAVATAACTSADPSGSSSTGSSSSGTAPASSSAAGGVYLALGDSVPFGYRAGEAQDVYATATNFTGYPELVGRSRRLGVVNAACPGETTASFLDTSAQSNGCENTPSAPAGFRTVFPLHTGYASGTQSQLDLALDTLRTKRDMRLVTLQIGANDAFLCQAGTADRCVSEAGTVARTVGANVDTILQRLRDDGGYTGTLVVLTYYALDYSDTPTALGTQALDAAITTAAQAHGARVADGYAAFRTAAAQAGGSSTTAGLVRPDDVHPTERGQELLARAVEAAADR